MYPVLITYSLTPPNGQKLNGCCMTDFVTKMIPIPVPRPLIDDPTRVDPAIAIRMPLEWPEKAAGAFSGGARYHPTGEDLNRCTGFLEAPCRLWNEMKEKTMEIGSGVGESLAQFYGWLGDKATPSSDLEVRLWLFGGFVVVLAGIYYFVWGRK